MIKIYAIISPFVIFKLLRDSVLDLNDENLDYRRILQAFLMLLELVNSINRIYSNISYW